MNQFDDLVFTPVTVELFWSWQGPFAVQEHALTEGGLLWVKGNLSGLYLADWNEDYLSFRYSDGPHSRYRGRMVLALLIEHDDKEAVFRINEEVDGTPGGARPNGRPVGR